MVPVAGEVDGLVSSGAGRSWSSENNLCGVVNLRIVLPVLFIDKQVRTTIQS